MRSPFDAYSRFYDLLYADKDYAGEATYLAAHLRRRAPGARRILELGCGTGGHAIELARLGYQVHGIDLSDSMLAQAQARRAALPADLAARLRFSAGDARSVRVGEGGQRLVADMEQRREVPLRVVGQARPHQRGRQGGWGQYSPVSIHRFGRCRRAQPSGPPCHGRGPP